MPPRPLRPRLGPVAYPVAFGLGAVLGTFWDRFHVASGALVYSDSGIAGQPWWIPFEFGAAFAMGVAAFAFLGDPAPREASAKAAAIETLWLTAVYAMTAFFDRSPWLVLGLLLAALALRARDLATVVAANPVPVVLLVVGGSLYEAMLGAVNVDAYRTTQLGSIPVWLPLLWLNAALFMTRTTEALLQRFGVRRRAEPSTAVVESSLPDPAPQPEDDEV